MEGFSIIGEHSFINVLFREVYEQDVQIIVEIKCRDFYLKTENQYIPLYELRKLYTELQQCQQKLNGEINISNYYDNNFQFSITYNDLGHVRIDGKFSETCSFSNEFIFSFDSDQTFMSNTLLELNKIIAKYYKETPR